jgi:hypothetical protein
MIRVASEPAACDSGGVAMPRIIQSASEGAERLLDRILCVAGAVLFSQMPEFMQQYLQRLGGHLDEARLVLERFRDAAAKSGMSLEQLAAGAGQSPDPAVGRLGAVIRGAAVRVDELAAADAALRHASLWARPFVFITHLDRGIARATLEIYRPAVPTTVEGFVYAGFGVIAIMVLYQLLVRGPVVRLLRRRAAPS